MREETLAWLVNLLTWQYLLGIAFQLMFLAELTKNHVSASHNGFDSTF